MAKAKRNFTTAMVMLVLIVGMTAGGLLAMFLTNQASILEEEVGVSGSATWNIYVRDILNKANNNVTSGTLYIYDMTNPLNALESLTVTNGKVTTVMAYETGDYLFLKYVGTTWLNYGMTITIPKLDRDYDTVPNKDLKDESDIVYVYKAADLSGTDVDGLRDNTVVWEDGTSGVDAFNASAYNQASLGIQLTNEDDDTAYVDPRSWTDHSSDRSSLKTRGGWLILEFKPVNGSDILDDAELYMRFTNPPSGYEKFSYLGSVWVIYPLDTQLKAGVRDVDSAGDPLNSLDARGVRIFTITIDFTTISAALNGDDIDIQISFASSYDANYLKTTGIVNQSGDNPLGEMVSAWTNDWSIGGVGG